MAFRFPFSKSKEPLPTASSAPPSLPPAAIPKSSLQPPQLVAAPSSTMVRPLNQVKAIVPGQGTLATALKAATAQPPPIVSGGSQSAVFKPRVNVTLGRAVPPATTIPRLPSTNAETPPSSGSDAPSSIDFSFADLAPLLPDNLVLASAPHGTLPTTVSIPMSEILPQLATGKVQVHLSSITHGIPPEAIDPAIASSGDIRIKIPLHLIIPRLPASAISLPSSQSKQELDPKIAAPFTERDASHAATTPPADSPEAAPPTAPVQIQPLPPRAPVPPPSKPVRATPPPALPSATPKPFVAPTTPSAGVGPTLLAPSGLKLPSIPKPPSPSPSPAVRPPVPAVPPISTTPRSVSIPPCPPAAMPAPAAPRTAIAPILSPAAAPRAMPTLRSSQPPAVPRPLLIPPAPPAAMPVSVPPLNIKLPPIRTAPTPPISAPSISTPSLPKSAPLTPEAFLAPKPLPRPSKVIAVAPPGKEEPSILQLLGLPATQTFRLQDLVELARQKLDVPGLLVAAQDGLPLAGKMPEGLDANAWSGIGPQLFRKFSHEGKALELEKPRRCLLGLGPNWFTLWSEQGIYLICCHGAEKVNPEFDQASSMLAAGLARFCKQHATAA
ncbi:MAG: hypothetical protein ACOYMV_02505 [Verrucomicrobiia bacterium]